jgi:hypothetical protein
MMYFDHHCRMENLWPVRAAMDQLFTIVLDDIVSVVFLGYAMVYSLLAINLLLLAGIDMESHLNENKTLLTLLFAVTKVQMLI